MNIRKNLNNMYLHQLDIQKKNFSKLNLKQYLLKNKIQFEIINKIDKKIKSKIRKILLGFLSVPHGYLNQSLLKYLIENYIMFMDQTYQKIGGRRF